MPLEDRAGQLTFSRSRAEGAPAVFIHCALAHHGAWAGVWQMLKGLRCTGFDLPGHGRSAAWDGTADFTALSTEVAASFAEEPIHLIGHSFGAVVALRLAAARPECVRSLTLVEPVMFAAAKGRPEYAAYESTFRPFAEAFDAGDLDAAAQVFNRLWGAMAWADIPPTQRAYMVERIALIPATAPGIVEDVDGILSSGRIARIDCPVALVQGGQSPAIIGAILEDLNTRLPQATRHRVEGAGHMAPMSHAREVAEIIAQVVARAA